MPDSKVFTSCLRKQAEIQNVFAPCTTPEQLYEKIIELGRTLPSYPKELKTPEWIVKGCQSVMYLHAEIQEGKLHFQAASEALISAGLASLLLFVYQDESPETILFCPPTFLETLGIHTILSPGRSNGLANLFQQMKQAALRALLPK